MFVPCPPRPAEGLGLSRRHGRAPGPPLTPSHARSLSRQRAQERVSRAPWSPGCGPPRAGTSRVPLRANRSPRARAPTCCEFGTQRTRKVTFYQTTRTCPLKQTNKQTPSDGSVPPELWFQGNVRKCRWRLWERKQTDPTNETP